jgi:hypothetical protein
MKYDELRRLAEAATPPGPWTPEDVPGTSFWQVWHLAPGAVERVNADLMSKENALYIAAASPDVVLGLLDEIERLRDVINQAAQDVGRVLGPCLEPATILHEVSAALWGALPDDPNELRPRNRSSTNRKDERMTTINLPPGISRYEVDENGERYPVYTDAGAHRLARAAWGVHFLLPHPDDAPPGYALALRNFHRALTGLPPLVEPRSATPQHEEPQSR